MIADLIPVAVGGFPVAVLAGIFTLMYRALVQSYREQVAVYRQQAVDWRESYRLEREAHDQTRQQLIQVLAPLSSAAGQVS